MNTAQRRRARRVIIARRFLARTFGVRFLVALILSALVWTSVTLGQNPDAEALFQNDLQVNEVNRGPNLVLASAIQAVRVTIGGPRQNLEQLRVNDFVARVDLAGIGAGVHQVPVEVQVSDPAVEVVRITPDTVTVQIDPFEIRAFEVTARLESAPAVGFRFERNEVVSNPAVVQVSGGASDVDEVVSVIANLSLEGATSDVSTQALLVPTDRSGNEVENVRLDPQTAQVRVPITRITSRKRVPVLAELAGTVAPGFFVREINVVPTTVEIQGQPEEIERVNAVSTIPLDVDGARGDVEGNVSFDSPVEVLSDRPTATIVVMVEPLADTTTIQAAVVAVNAEPNLTVAVSEPSVQVVVGGSVETLRALRAGDIVAELDLANLSPGRHQLRPIITVPPGIEITQVAPPVLTVELQPDTTSAPASQSQALIGPGGAVATPTPTPQPTPTPTLTPRPGRTAPIS